MAHSHLRLWILLCLLALVAGLLSVSIPFPLSPLTISPGPSTDCPVAEGPLERGRAVVCELAPEGEHTFRISLAAGDFLRAAVEQRGVDARVTLVGPAGEELLVMDSPNGRKGEEPVLAVAKTSGTYQLRVKGDPANLRGSYLVIVQDLRPATKDDRLRAAAISSIAEGDRLKRQNSTEPALESYRASLQTWVSLQDPQGQTLSLIRIGELFKQQERWQEALGYFVQALPLTHVLGDQRMEAHLLNWAGFMLRNLNRREEALDSFLKALAVSLRVGTYEEQAHAYNGIGLVQKSRGQVPEALASYQASIHAWKEADEPTEEARTLCNLGELYLALGQPEQALRSFNEAFGPLRQERRDDVRLACLTGAGMAHHDLSSPQTAQRLYERALTLSRVGESSRAFALSRLALVYRDLKDLRRASVTLKEALRIAQELGDRQMEAFALADLAHVEDLQGHGEKAIEDFDRALLLAQKLDHMPAMASILYGRAQVERNLRRLDEALASIQRSIEIVERLRVGLIDPDDRVSFFASRHRYYELYIDLLIEKHRRSPDETYLVRAFEASEQSRARTLLDDYAAPALSLKEIQREVIDGNSLMLSYALGERRSFLWVVGSDSIAVFELPERTEIESLAREVWERLSSKETRDLQEASRKLRDLSRMLLPAEIEALGSQRLLISPEGALHLVPFAALCDPALPESCDKRTFRPLLQDHEISHLPSASVVGQMRRSLKTRPAPPPTVAVFADPVFGRAGTLTSLPASREEAEAIRELVPEAGLFLRFDANRANATNPALRQFGILHFATHNIQENHPDLSGLMLSRYDEQGNPRDGFLRVREIYNLDLPVELVVLSACGTGLGQEVRGEGILGLTRAFLHAGAKRVVVSLWDVPDGKTSKLMSSFYNEMLKGGLPPAAALRNAQLAMMKGRPRSWIGFVLQGEPR